MSIFSQRKELEELRQQVQDLQAEKADMELMFQAITEHADIVEEELITEGSTAVSVRDLKFINEQLFNKACSQCIDNSFATIL